MAWEFVYDGDALSTIETNLSTASANLTRYNLLISSKIKGLGTYWKGPDYEALVGYMDEYKTVLDEIPKMFDTFSSKVNLMGLNGTLLYNTIKANLNFDAVPDRSYVPAAESSEAYYVGYSIDADSYETADQIRDRAEEIQLNLQADIEVILAEINDQEIILAALEANKDNIPNADALIQAQKDKIDKLYKDYLPQYMYAYNEVTKSLGEGSNDFLDMIFNRVSKDGKLHEASDHWFNSKDSVDDAREGAEELNVVLSELPPLSVVCETANLNASYVYNTYEHDDGHIYDQFRNGSNTSQVAMESSFHIEASKGKVQEIDIHTIPTQNAKKVEMFNSMDFLQSGMNDDYLYTSGTHTFSQFDAYGTSGVETYQDGNGNSFDSVKITREDGSVQYLTYAQYTRLSNNFEDNHQLQ